ncbi:MAG: hypothetical protein K5872_03450 [Rhizobiaceae bacterium]|nr:hypothetical protein [Rhizobiaceae bacterium]MCV0405266.1 hypothetical protein [Rhizobiaceae bacterium]
MDGNAATDLNRIKRVVALLLSLAMLAERAAARPAAVRLFVHSLLLGAEFAALTLFIEPAEIEACAARQAPRGTEPCDLIRMAVGLRALAILLAVHCAVSAGGRERTYRQLVVVRPRLLQPGSGPDRLNDTS